MCGDGGYKGGEAEVERDAPLLALRILVESGGRDDAARFWVFGFRVFGLGFSSRGTSQILLLSQPPHHEQKKQKKLVSPLVLRHQSVGLSCGSNRTVFAKPFSPTQDLGQAGLSRVDVPHDAHVDVEDTASCFGVKG